MQHATERVERPGESQEALDGKKQMMNIMRFRIKINCKSTRVLPKDDDDRKRTTERILRVP